MADFATCMFVYSNPLKVVSTIHSLGGTCINQLTVGANCGNVRGFLVWVFFSEKKFGEEEPVGRRKLNRKSAKAQCHELLTSKHNGSIFDSYHIRHSRTSSYPAWHLKTTTNSNEMGRQDFG